MMKFTRPSALHAMGATFKQLQAYTDELSKYLKANAPGLLSEAYKELDKGNGNDPAKKSRSRSRKARKEKKEETEE